MESAFNEENDIKFVQQRWRRARGNLQIDGPCIYILKVTLPDTI